MHEYDKYPYVKVLDKPIGDFRVYVTSNDYFMSRLPVLAITMDRSQSKWDDILDYYRTIFGVYCASFCCGVSKQHLNGTHPIITSIIHYHLYFMTRRIIRIVIGW